MILINDSDHLTSSHTLTIHLQIQPQVALNIMQHASLYPITPKIKLQSSKMEQQYTKPRTNTALSNLITHEEDHHKNKMQSTLRLSSKSRQSIYDHHHDNLLYSPPRSSTTNMYSLHHHHPPSSPESPWTLSPHHTPSPSLLYHCIASLHRNEGTIYSIAAAKGLVFTGSESHRIRAWRQPDCTERGYFTAKHGDVRVILAHGNTLFTSHKDCKVRMWNRTSSVSPEHFKAKKITTFPKTPPFLSFPRITNTTSNLKHKGIISCMAYNHAEGILYTGSWDKKVKAWRVSDNRCVDSFIAHEDNINAILINQEDGSLFTCSSDGSVKIWRRVYGQSSHTLTMTLKFQLSPINALALAISSSTTPTLQEKRHFSTDVQMSDFSGSTNSCFLYSGSSDGFINFWEKEKNSGRYNHGGILQGHRFAVLCLVSIEKLIFSGSEDTTIRVWRREEGSFVHECLAVLDAHRGPVKCLAASLEIEKSRVMGFLVYSAGLDQVFKVWRIKVLPEEKESGLLQGLENIDINNINNNVDMKMKIEEYEMSPVLSPSWVEKKLQGNIHPFH